MHCVMLTVSRSRSTILLTAVAVLASSGGVQSIAWAELKSTSATAESSSSEQDSAALATPTHHQTGLIKADVDSLPNRSLKCFCLTPDNRIVAGCAGGLGELRVFSDTGEYAESWLVPFEPEAIFVRADGKIFLAGAGQLARLSPTGTVELQQPAPHATSMSQNLDKIRVDVVEQHKQQGKLYVEQAEQYGQLIDQAAKQIDELKKQIVEFGDQADDAVQKQVLEQQLAMQVQMKQQYEQVKKQFDEMVAQNKPKELTEAEIDELVKQSIQYKQQASSISATDDEVFLATHAGVGYGFDVWKMDADFAGGKTIITGLSGCCGQMDVKANDNGLFVAENSKHRVCRYDGDGQEICNWGHGAGLASKALVVAAIR